MASRKDFHTLLVSLLPGVKVYYQPPSKLQYPCLIYNLDGIRTGKANNGVYKKDRRYVLTYYSLSPDPTLTIDGEEVLVEDILLGLPKCSFDRTYTADNIHHYVFTIYF